MDESSFNKFLSSFASYFFGSLFFGAPFILYFLLKDEGYFWLGIIVTLLYFFTIGYLASKSVNEEVEKKCKLEIQNKDREIIDITKNKDSAEEKAELWKKTLKEKTLGFPSLLERISEYEELSDKALSNYLFNKPHPAYSSAQLVKIEAKRRREAEYEAKNTRALIEYYENIAPFLLDFKGEIIDENEDAIRDYSEEEREDPITNYLTKEEYRKLPSITRNQMALDRYWSRSKPKWLLGRIYERYVGYLYEAQGYSVEYTGIFHGYEDLGRDLICVKGNEIIVIQCKNWSQFKTIYEKHIFQFFGTVFQYRDINKKKKVKAIFYTTTELSELARRFAQELGIDLKEKEKMIKDYPCIKCHISNSKEKIYHLPFDQQYDNTKIEINKGDFYCCTVEEAEKKGFRRAYRWHGKNE